MAFRVTAAQVAERAGVSRSAVSRSFSKTAYIAPGTRRKVLKIASELGYRPNGVASSLASGKSNIVAIITNSRPDPLRSQILHLLNVALQEEGYVPYVISVGKHYDGAKSLTNLIQMPLATAIVSADNVTCRHIAPYCSQLPPIIINDRLEKSDIADRVVVDDSVGIQEMVRYLQSRNKRRLWQITARRSASAYEIRNNALSEALIGKNITLLDREEGDFTYDGGKRAFEALIARGICPIASFAQMTRQQWV